MPVLPVPALRGPKIPLFSVNLYGSPPVAMTLLSAGLFVFPGLKEAKDSSGLAVVALEQQVMPVLPVEHSEGPKSPCFL